jgi:hypothetical protein
LIQRSGEEPLIILKMFRGSNDFTLTINILARLMQKYSNEHC